MLNVLKMFPVDKMTTIVFRDKRFAVIKNILLMSPKSLSKIIGNSYIQDGFVWVGCDVNKIVSRVDTHSPDPSAPSSCHKDLPIDRGFGEILRASRSG